MRKFLTAVFTVLLAASLAFAQNTGGDKASKTGGGTAKDTTGKKPAATESKTKSKKGHKGGKKGKAKGKSKSTGTSTGSGATPPPK